VDGRYDQIVAARTKNCYVAYILLTDRTFVNLNASSIAPISSLNLNGFVM
jgi:hypothetical protein